MFIFGTPVDVKKAQGWIKSWIGLKDVCNVGCVDTSRESYARLGGGGDIKGWKDFKEKESRRTPPLAVWRNDLREKLDFQRKSNQDVEGKTSQSKPMPRRRREMDAPEKAKVTCGSPLRLGRRTWSNNADRGDGETGVQNSFRCLSAENLCLAKRVNRDISEMSFLGHFEPFWVIFGPY